MQEPAPTDGPNVPFPHDVHAAAPVNEYVPMPHAVQFEDAPTAELNVPAMHETHVADDVAAVMTLNVPAPHGVHKEAPFNEYLPGAHGSHAAARSAELNEPAAHETQAVDEFAPIIEPYLPALHCVHDAAAPNEYVPEPHAMHVADEFAPSVMLNEPAAHGLQDVDEFAPMEEPKVPVLHLVHTAAPPNEYAPMPQAVHVAHEFAPTVLLNEPAVHATHAVEEFAPITEPYVPAPHDVHPVAPPDEYVPVPQALHVADEFVLLKVPAAHETQAVEESAPTDGPYVPAAHGVHAAAPASEYVPAPQVMQVAGEFAPTV